MQIPDNDPNLPSYLDIPYREAYNQLMYVYDAWEGKKNWTEFGDYVFESPGRFAVQRFGGEWGAVRGKANAQLYLPQETAETDSAYNRRLQRSLYKNFYKKIINGFAGMFTDFELTENVPASLKEWADDIDMKGNTLSSFKFKANCLALRDGFVGIYTDFPPMPRNELGLPLINSVADEKEFNRRQWTRFVLRQDILSAVPTKVNGKFVFTKVVVRENTVEPDPASKYGDVSVTRYRVHYPDRWELVEIQEDAMGKLVPVVVDEGENGIGVIPLVMHTLTETDPRNSYPPLLSLAEMTFSYYALYSEYREVMHMCNLPVPVRRGLITEGMTREDFYNLPKINIGPHSLVDVPEKGDFFFAEPTGATTQITKEELAALAQDIMSEGLAFITQDTAGNKTATEMELTATQTKSIVEGMAEMAESSMEQVFSFWSLWENGPEEAGSIVINRDALQPAIEANAAQVIVGMVTQGLMSRESALNELKLRGFFSKAFDLEKELSMVPEVPLYEPEDSVGAE